MIKTKKKSSSSSSEEKLNKAKALLGDLKKKGAGGGGKDFLRLEDGKNVFRILPITTSEGDFYLTTKKHWNVGPDEQILKCPTAVNKPCPLCKAAKKETDKKEQRKLWPRTSYVMVVLPILPVKDLKNPKVLEVGTKAFRDILTFYTDLDEYGPLTDPEEGRDVVITKTGSKLNTEYDVKLRDLDKSIKVPASIIEQVTEKGPDLDVIYGEDTYPSAAKIEAAMEGVEFEEEAEDDEDEDEKPKRTANKGKKRKAKYTKAESSEEGDDEESEEEEEDEDADDDEESEEESKGEDDDEDEESEDADDDDEEEESESKTTALRKRLKAKARK